jgi:hypothetical protein
MVVQTCSGKAHQLFAEVRAVFVPTRRPSSRTPHKCKERRMKEQLERDPI